MSPLALQVIRDVGRARVYHLLLLATAGLFAAAPLLSALSMGDRQRGVVDLGLTALWLLAVAVAVYVGANAIGTDLERGSAAVFLSRPIPAAQFAAGRLMGALAALALFCIGATATFAVLALSRGIALSPALLQWTLMIWAEAAVLAALAMLLSSLVRTVPATFGAVGLWIAGHLVGPYGQLAAETQDPAMGAVHAVLSVLLPDLSTFDVQVAVVTSLPVGAGTVALALAYAALWVAGPFCATVLVLQHRDIA